jgi:hypothetical protein
MIYGFPLLQFIWFPNLPWSLVGGGSGLFGVGQRRGVLRRMPDIGGALSTIAAPRAAGISSIT